MSQHLPPGKAEAFCFLCSQSFRTYGGYLQHRFESPNFLIVRRDGCFVRTPPRERPNLSPTAATSSPR